MEDISLHILDIAENSVNAGAKLIQIRIMEDRAGAILSIEIEDDGRGIAPERVDEVLDPFFTSRTTRKVGLGLPFLKQAARETGGEVIIKSAQGEGTLVSAVFRTDHIDMKPVGDVGDTLIALIAGNPEIDFVLSYEKGEKEYSLDTREIRAVLEDVPLNSPDVLSALRSEIKKALNDLDKAVE